MTPNYAFWLQNPTEYINMYKDNNIENKTLTNGKNPSKIDKKNIRYTYDFHIGVGNKIQIHGP